MIDVDNDWEMDWLRDLRFRQTQFEKWRDQADELDRLYGGEWRGNFRVGPSRWQPLARRRWRQMKRHLVNIAHLPD